MKTLVTPLSDNPKTLTDQCYISLRNDIIQGQLEPGFKLRIEHLRKHYEVGATPLREALSKLTADGFVHAQGQRGFCVAPVSLQDLQEITELRVMLETHAVRMSVKNGDDQWEARVVAAFHTLSRWEEDSVSDIEQWEVRNFAFHDAVMSGHPSAWLSRFHQTLYDQHRRYRNICLRQRSIPRKLHEEHQRICDAALARDADTCCAETEQHIRRTADIAQQVLANH